jgi:hypothetical protein
VRGDMIDFCFETTTNEEEETSFGYDEEERAVQRKVINICFDLKRTRGNVHGQPYLVVRFPKKNIPYEKRREKRNTGSENVTL